MSVKLRLTGLLRHPTEPRVLLLRSDRTWRLPRVVASAEWIADVDAPISAYEARLRTRPWMLRNVSFAYDDERDVIDAVQELELAGAWTPPANGRWVARSELDGLRLVPGERTLVEAYLDAPAAIPPGRPAWSLTGWRDELVNWLDAELGRLGRRRLALEQVKVWGISTVVLVRTDGGDLWFKASAPLPLFANEGTVTARLASRFPGHVPGPVAVEPGRGWLLLEPFEVVGWGAPLEVRCELFRRTAGLQIRAAGLAGELLDDGCLDRRLDGLGTQLDELLADRGALHRLTTGEVRALRRLAPRFHDLIRRLDALGLPPTLVHGDLHPGNVARIDGELVCFDWTDACVAHPFFDLHSLQWERDGAARAAILDAYLEPWREVAPEETLLEAVRLAGVVTPLHHAVSYSTIARSIEPTSRAEIDATHELLREAMARVREL